MGAVRARIMECMILAQSVAPDQVEKDKLMDEQTAELLESAKKITDLTEGLIKEQNFSSALKKDQEEKEALIGKLKKELATALKK